MWKKHYATMTPAHHTIDSFVQEKIAAEDAPLSASLAQQKKAKKEAVVPPVAEDLPNETIAIGDDVRMIGGDTIGNVLELKGKTARVQMGNFITTAKVDQLLKVRRQKQSTSFEKVGGIVRGVDMNQKRADFSATLDIRGFYAGDAMAEVEDFLDNALMLGTRELRIVHGKGNGILKTQIRNLLKKYSQVEKMVSEHPDFGGDGVTIVSLK
jgi:DNA mismatch repair protein MutS2